MTTAAAQIRFARPDEAALIARLSRDTIEAGLPWRWQPPDIERFIGSRRHNVIVAGTGERIAGFAVMGYSDDEAYLALLAVAPGHRRGGLARRMLDWLMKTAEVAGVRSVAVELREDNLAAYDLYRRAGFAELSRRTGGYYGRVNQIRMRRELRPE
jgi:ribosomal-protein-alanine N-acetyltransferase